MSKNNAKDQSETLRRDALAIIVRHSWPATLVPHGVAMKTVYPRVGFRLIQQELRRLGYSSQDSFSALKMLRDRHIVELSGSSKLPRVQLS